MEAAVCLKRFPGGYVLGVSDKERDLKLWFAEELDEAESHYGRFVEVMQETGTPFGEAVD